MSPAVVVSSIAPMSLMLAATGVAFACSFATTGAPCICCAGQCHEQQCKKGDEPDHGVFSLLPKATSAHSKEKAVNYSVLQDEWILYR